ncbi:MAG: hypothetical protein AAFY88_04855 [Acidobacteriota bacterium]
MFKLKLIFFCFLFAMTANSALALGLFGASGADCDGQPGLDVMCSGDIACVSVDEAPGVKGFCECRSADGTIDRKECSDRPVIVDASFGSSHFWLQTEPLKSSACPTEIPEVDEVDDADQSEKAA